MSGFACCSHRSRFGRRRLILLMLKVAIFIGGPALIDRMYREVLYLRYTSPLIPENPTARWLLMNCRRQRCFACSSDLTAGIYGEVAAGSLAPGSPLYTRA